ncbi:hypothetical protein RLOatenuis_7380 [Rickettsiales bacterium]|nr:hypothetical protein RLOatenuis_7380 [Rickettsiales bacterium]
MVKPGIRYVKESVATNSLKPFDGLVLRNSKKGKSSELITQEELDKRSRVTKLWDRFLISIGARPDYERVFQSHHIEEYSNIPWERAEKNAKTRELTIKHDGKKFSLTYLAVEKLVLGLGKLRKTGDYGAQKEGKSEAKSKLKELSEGLFAHTSLTFQEKYDALYGFNEGMEEINEGMEEKLGKLDGDSVRILPGRLQGLIIPEDKIGIAEVMNDPKIAGHKIKMNASNIIYALKERAEAVLYIEPGDLSASSTAKVKQNDKNEAGNSVQIHCENKKDGTTHNIATATLQKAGNNLKLLIEFSEALQDASSKDQKNNSIEITLNKDNPYPFRAQDFAQGPEEPLLGIMKNFTNNTTLRDFLKEGYSGQLAMKCIRNPAYSEEYRNNPKALHNMRKNLIILRQWHLDNGAHIQLINEAHSTLDKLIEKCEKTEQKPKQDGFPNSLQSKGAREEAWKVVVEELQGIEQFSSRSSRSFSEDLADERASKAAAKENKEPSVPRQ